MKNYIGDEGIEINGYIIRMRTEIYYYYYELYYSIILEELIIF